MSIRILIADDHGVVRAGLRALLNTEANLQVVGEASSGEEAIRLAQDLSPDIALMDISMPDTGGIEATRLLREVAPNVKVLILSVHEDKALMQEALRVGAYGYITKRAVEPELIDAIYAVWRGIVYVHPTLMRSLLTPAPETPCEAQQEKEALTTREVEVLRLIVQGHTNRQIAVLLNISTRTVESHRSNIMDKLNLHSRVELVRYAADHGLLDLDKG